MINILWSEMNTMRMNPVYIVSNTCELWKLGIKSPLKLTKEKNVFIFLINLNLAIKICRE